MKTSAYPYQKYAFEDFNPIQDAILPLVDEDSNVIVSAPTSSGKTICGELIAGKVLKEGKRVIYTSPLKALAEERFQDWSSDEHPWQGYPKIVLTGDYKLTPAREKELERARIIITTYEMLAVRARRASLEKHTWVEEAGVLIVDEAHFLSSDGRGDHLENALIGFTRMNPSARIVFLSATLKNYEEIQTWLYLLTQRATLSVSSAYRPCQLTMHYRGFMLPGGVGWGNYEQAEEAKVEQLLSLVEEFREDQWLIFVHAKSMGKRVVAALNERGLLCQFHNADLDRDRRAVVEQHFKDRKLKYLVATSTLAYGLNLPARRVAIMGVNRGMTQVDPLDIIQECGRAGRPRYDTEGDAYVIMEQDKIPYWMVTLKNGVDVHSKLHDHIGFHLIGEIAEKRVKSVLDSSLWAKKTLAAHQKLWRVDDVRAVFDQFKSRRLIRPVGWTDDGNFEVTTLGRIAAHHYFDPIDVADWHLNLQTLKERKLLREPVAIAWMWSCVGSNKGFISKEMRYLCTEYLRELQKFNLRTRTDGATVVGAVLWKQMTGHGDEVKLWPQILMPILMDGERVLSCLSQIDSRVLRGRDSTYWDVLWYKIKYGIGWETADLCRLPGIGPVYATALFSAGIRSIEEFFANRNEARSVLPAHVFKEAVSGAPSTLVRDESDPPHRGSRRGKRGS